jgi:hypothetical protein
MLQGIFQHAPPHDAEPDDGQFVFHAVLLFAPSLTMQRHFGVTCQTALNSLGKAQATSPRCRQWC